MSSLLEKYRRDVVGIAWVAVSCFLALSLLTYHSTDPSLNSTSSGAVKSAGPLVHNACGYFGSFLADILFQLFGITAFSLVMISGSRAVSAFKGNIKGPRLFRVLLLAIFLLTLSSLLGLYFPLTRIFGGEILVGGILGGLVSRGLVAVFNFAGVAVILWSAAAVLFVFLTEKRMVDLMQIGKSFAMDVFGSVQKIVANRIAERKVKTIAEDVKPIVEAQALFPIKEMKEKFFPKKVETPKAVKVKDVFKAPIRQVENWQMPPLELLQESLKIDNSWDEREIQRNAKVVEQKLAEFNVLGQVVGAKPGPAVTMYEFRPAASIKINDITKLADDLSLALSAESLRIIAPIPGRDVVGIETSNSKRNNINMKDLLESQEFWNEEVRLPVALGKSATGDTKIIDLRRLPHLLVAGTTGSGKSVFIMSLITSLIMRHSPKTLRLILIDPKQVDLAVFHKIPHLLLPPVKEPRPAVNTLKWLIREMEKRYRSMSQFNAKSLEAFNQATERATSEDLELHENRVKALEDNPQTANQSYYFKPQPYVVAVIEEFADLMTVDRNGVEPAVVRLAQMARASGIHLVIAMQSPRREVLTGLIKTNFPGRISFKVASKVDSSIILDQRGAERLLSVGDMLYLAPGVGQPQRYHGAFLKDEEMNGIADFWIKQGEPVFDTLAEKVATSSVDMEENPEEFGFDPAAEEGYDEVVAYVSSQKEVSASLLQRRFRFGYPKAARIIEILETEGVVGPSNGSKPRQVLVNRLD